MRTVKPIKETTMVTGQGVGFGLDFLPYDRKTKQASEKVRDKKLTYGELERLVRRLVLDS